MDEILYCEGCGISNNEDWTVSEMIDPFLFELYDIEVETCLCSDCLNEKYNDI